MFTRSGSATWQGGLKDGNGTVSTQSGALNELSYGFNKRFGDEPGTNPEELVGAAHAACFSMALSNMLSGAGIGNIDIKTTSKITLEKDGDGFTVTKAHLVTQISADGDKAQIEELELRDISDHKLRKVLRDLDRQVGELGNTHE